MIRLYSSVVFLRYGLVREEEAYRKQTSSAKKKTPEFLGTNKKTLKEEDGDGGVGSWYLIDMTSLW